jgi:trans-aconitate methyltransferase
MSTASPSDPTFRPYNATQAQSYAAERTAYPTELYDTVFKHHVATGGRTDLLLDVGCGPGNATRDLAIVFDRAIGTDPGAEMIIAARQLGGRTRSGEEIRFEVSPAEEISKVNGVEPGSVDLLTAAMAVSRLVIRETSISNSDH